MESCGSPTAFTPLSDLLQILEMRDHAIFTHGLRVGMYASRLAECLGLDQERTTMLQWAARLHDLGKVCVSPIIIDKKGCLAQDEMVLVRHHAAAGAAVLAVHQQPRLLIECAHHHHERWDGTGYPNRLQGVQIPMFARITAVADAYDAMTSPRSYREVVAHEQAVEEIRAHAGTQFCPEVVSVFLEHATEDWSLHAVV